MRFSAMRTGIAFEVSPPDRLRLERLAKNTSHVRNAIARFNQVKGVSDEERDAAWKRIEAAAKKHGVQVSEKSWREIGKK